MDDYGRRRRGLGETLLNFLTLLVSLGTLIAGGVLLALFLNPQLPLNPFPPPEGSTPAPMPSAEATLPPSPVPSLTPTATETAAPSPTATSPPPTHTPVVVLPSPTPVPYLVQEGTPALTQAFLDQSCDWMGVGGQVFGFHEEPALDVWVQVGGTLDGSPLDLVSLPGSATGYGEGGYEIQLSEGPVASEGTLWIQLIDPEGHPLSEKLSLTTSESCSENLVLVNWLRGRE